MSHRVLVGLLVLSAGADAVIWVRSPSPGVDRDVEIAAQDIGLTFVASRLEILGKS